MSWYSIDAIDITIKRTKKALAEPFDFWKWIKLGLIGIFVGGGFGGSNISNTGTFNEPAVEKETARPSIEEVFNQISQFWHQYQTYILIAVAVIIFLLLIFGLIASIMEFVLVESLVTNVVAIRAYFRKYLRSGFNLFIIRLVLGITFLSVFILLMLSILLPFLESPGNISFGMILSAVLWFIVVWLPIAIISLIINSFISLSIPVAMYQEKGIIAAIKKIIGKFRADWKQIIVYWLIRIILGLVVGIIVGIVALILLLIMLAVIFLVGAILYFILFGLGAGTSSPLFWVVMILYGVVALIPFTLFILLASAPVPVFMRYHLLSFLQLWYPEAGIPFFDAKIIET